GALARPPPAASRSRAPPWPARRTAGAGRDGPVLSCSLHSLAIPGEVGNVGGRRRAPPHPVYPRGAAGCRLPDARRPRRAVATSAALTAATCGVLTGFVSSRPTGLGRSWKASGGRGASQGGTGERFTLPCNDRNDWSQRSLEDADRSRALLERTRTIAVLGIEPETRADRPAHAVPRRLQAAGYRIIPVPVYYPEVTEILGERVYRRVADIPEPVDIVEVFRKPDDIPPHLPD